MIAHSRNDRSQPIGSRTHILTDEKPPIGSEVTIVNQDGNTVNIGKVLEVKKNPPTFFKKNTVVAEIIA